MYDSVATVMIVYTHTHTLNPFSYPMYDSVATVMIVYTHTHTEPIQLPDV